MKVSMNMTTSVARHTSKAKRNKSLNSRADNFESRAIHLLKIQAKFNDSENVHKAVSECSKIVFDVLSNSEAALYIGMGGEQYMLEQIIETQIVLYELFIKLDDISKDSAESYFE